jgi:hypothetical protein
MDDISIKSSKTIYNNEKVIFGIRRYILEYIIWIDRVLTNLKRARCTILRAKSQFCIFRFRVIKFICDILGRYSDTFKIIKIVK